MKTKLKILDLLQKQNGSYLSGEELSRQLSISRAAVWKNIKALREEGYQIEAVTNRGYRLNKEQDMFSEFELQKQLKRYPETADCPLHFFDTVSSTNRAAKALAEEGTGITVVAAKEQTQGRGRKNRDFFSPNGGIYLSAIFYPHLYVEDSMYLTMSAAVAAVRAVEEYCGVKAGIKWPNDLVYQGKKLCGILMETSVEAETGRIQSAVIGLGMNVNTDHFPEELEPLVTSLKQVTQKTWSRTQLLSRILVWLMRLVPLCETETGRQEIGQAYRELSVLLGKTVTVLEKGERFEARILDIQKDGRLVLEDQEGKQRLCGAGEVSVRVGGKEQEQTPFF